MNIGIDLGGTKIEILAIDDAGTELLRRRVLTPSSSYQRIIEEITALVHHAEDELGMKGTVGVGIPGIVSPSTGLVKNANTTVLIGHPLDKDLESLLQRPIAVENDANCFVLSESRDGAAKDGSVVFGVIIGTGTGGGICVNGKILRGRLAIAGEWGHNPLPWPDAEEYPGTECFCGKRGCIETWLSGPGLTHDHTSISGNNMPANEIGTLAESGDSQAEQSIKRYERRLAKSLATVINILDPDVVVLGGGLSNIRRLYENVPKILPEYVLSDVVDTPIVQARHGDSSGVRGAAFLPMDAN